MKIHELTERKNIRFSRKNNTFGSQEFTTAYVGKIKVESVKYDIEQLKRRPFFLVLHRILSAKKVKSKNYDRNKMLKLLKIMRVDYHDVDPREYGFMWDGNKISIGNSAANVAHDIAHWQLSHKNRRAKPEFGLGPGPETRKTDAASSAKSIPWQGQNKEESEASLLGILWELYMGMSSVRYTFEEHNWIERGIVYFDNLEEYFNALLSRHVINAKGEPSLMANAFHEYK